jgi:hypothetical protein
VKPIRISTVAATLAPITSAARRSAGGLSASGSARWAERARARITAMPVAITTSSQTAPHMAVNHQNRNARLSAFGPCGSSADCQPEQPPSSSAGATQESFRRRARISRVPN